MEYINRGLDLINSASPAFWCSVGYILAAILTTIGVVAWINRRNLKKYGEKLESVFTILNVAFWGFLLAAGELAIAITTQAQPLGAVFPQLFTYWPQISGGAILVHTVARYLHRKWEAKRDGKKITNTLPDLKPLVEQVTAPVTASSRPSSSFGAVAAGQEQYLEL